MIDKRKQGKRNKINGANWELKVRADLEAKGYIICKWHNQVDLELNKLVPAKHKFNFFTKVMSLGSGFPDFIIYKLDSFYSDSYKIIGVECKCGKYLDKLEKEKCSWIIENKIFSKILIAKKSKKRGEIEVIEFGEN